MLSDGQPPKLILSPGCDQQNILEQAKNGIAALRMPTGELLALPKETSRWEWKWFRQAFVYVGARIIQGARRAKVYLAGCHRFVEHLIIASRRLQYFTFT